MSFTKISFLTVVCFLTREFSSPSYATSRVGSNDKLSVFSPESILPAGVDESISTNPYTGESGPARKGTVAATLNNVALLNAALLEKKEDPLRINALMEAVSTLLPSLRAIGVFDLFTPAEWLSDTTQPGRIMAALLYIERYPDKIALPLKHQLHALQQKTKIRLVAEKIRIILEHR